MKIVQLTKVGCSRFPHSKLKAKNRGSILECHYTQIYTGTPSGGKPKSNVEPAICCRLTDIVLTLKCYFLQKTSFMLYALPNIVYLNCYTILYYSFYFFFHLVGFT